MTIETLSQNFTEMTTQPVPVNTQKDPKLNAKKFRENSHRWKSDRRYHRERWRLLSVGNAKALSVRCGDKSLIFIFYSVAISTEILTHSSYFLHINENWDEYKKQSF